MFNIRLVISYENYDLEVGEIEEMLFVTKIKTKRQRNFRTLKEFYREVENIKVNQVDRLFESFARDQPSIEEKFKEENEMIKEIGIDKEEVARLFKAELLEEIERKEFL
ncbi:hypothetical protein [Oceanobacillus sp. FSL H7-0719]|uniref:hypothetical protein n=1 Tax=Oceanobacillus sp. FSL H7-0719 TaxID=2954507 RepID=UPI003249523D